MKNMFNLKDIISSIADVGQKLFKKTELKRNDLETILSLCDDLISNKGAAFGITVARDVTDLYQTLTHENKLAFFKKINEKFKPNHTKASPSSIPSGESICFNGDGSGELMSSIGTKKLDLSFHSPL